MVPSPLSSSEELKGVLEKPAVDDEQLFSSLASLQALHQTHLSPSLVPLNPDPTPSLAAALSPSLSPAQRWACLRDSRLVQRLYHQVYQLLEDTYYPHYCQSEQVGPIPIPSFTHSHSIIVILHSYILQFLTHSSYSETITFPFARPLCASDSSIPGTWYRSQMGSKVVRNVGTPLVWNEQLRGGVAEFPNSPPPRWRTSTVTPDQRFEHDVMMMSLVIMSRNLAL